ncbi:MAG: GxxExxY protein [Candidatus Solibacter sp.]
MGNTTEINALTYRIIAAAIEVHRALRPGLLESMYQECLCMEFEDVRISYQREVPLPIRYKNRQLSYLYRLDLLVEGTVILEIKAMEQLLPLHSAQLLTYLKNFDKQVGLLINFNVPVLKDGVRRVVNELGKEAQA